MKIRLPKCKQDGMAVIVVIAFLAILLIFVAGNLRMLHLLGNDLRLVEEQQTNRLAVAGITSYASAGSNAVPAATVTKPQPPTGP
jgi:hypothetical protein